MRLLKLTVLLMLSILCTSMVSAAFTAELEAVSDSSAQIYKDEIAEFWVDITNNGANNDRFSIYSLNPSWILDTEPDPVAVDAGETKRFKLTVDPTSVIQDSGLYSLAVTVQSRNTKETVSLNNEILIRSESHRQFQPAIRVTATVGDDMVVDPRKEVPVRIRLNNQNSLDIPKLTVFVESALFDSTYETSLSPNSDMIKLLSFDVDSFVSPQVDTIKVKVYVDGVLVSDKRLEYEIQKNQLLFQRDTEIIDRLLFDQYTVDLENVGNVKSNEVFSYEISWFANIFTSTTPESTFISENNRTALEFDVTLSPSEARQITVTTDYRATFYTLASTIVLLLIITFLYFAFRSPILVTKKASIVAEKDGGTQEIKILLNIRNRTNKNLENISVVDRIPDITEIEKEFSLGTLKPSKIVRHAKKGTLIKWDFPSIEGFEERIITYKIHSKLGILGGFEFPSTIVRFDTPSGNTRAVKSKIIGND